MILTKDQEFAKDKIDAYLKGKTAYPIIINGKAGTGKTTLLSEILLSNEYNHYTIAVATLTYKARNILMSKIGHKSNIEYFTLASLLNLSLDKETGEFVEDTNKKSIINKFSLIVIDEASMLDKKTLNLILKKKWMGAKMLFSLDFRQLPPIGDKECVLYNNKNYKTVHLNERVRQQVGNTILDYSDLYGDAVLNNTVANPVRVNSANIIYYDTIKKCLEDYKQDFIKQSKDFICRTKVVCYTNKYKDIINTYIRDNFINTQTSYYIKEGDLLILEDNYQNVLKNSEEVLVLESNLISKDDLLVYQCKVKSLFNNKEHLIFILDPISKDVFLNNCNKLYNQYLRNKKNKGLLERYWTYKESFAKVSYNYCTTVYKSQGSTYENTIVIEKDIMSCGIDNKQKMRAMYVAITRSSNKTIII